MNRAKDYYETAVEFMKIPHSGHLHLGNYFKLLKFTEYMLPGDQLSEFIFKEVIVRGHYTEFKQLVRNFKDASYQQ